MKPFGHITATELQVFHSYDIRESLKAAGFQWRADIKAWTCPLDDADALRVAHQAVIEARGDASAIGHVLFGRSAPASVTFAPGVDELAVISDAFGLALFDYQKVGAAWIRSRHSSLIGDEQGLGKTRQALAACYDRDRVLIVSPAVVKTNWSREASVGLNTTPLILHGRKASAVNPEARAVIVNYDILEAWVDELTAWKPQVVILDESHMIKSPKAQRTKAIMAIVKDTGASVVALSGTPMPNKPIELFPLLHITGALKHFGGNWAGYTQRYCDRKLRNGYFDVSGASNLGELSLLLREHLMIRRMKNDVLDELPEKRHVVVELDLEAALKEYTRLEKASAKNISKRVKALMRERKITATKAIEDASREAETISEIAELRKAAGMAKLDAGAAHILEHLESTGRKAVVFAHHHEVRAGLRERLAEAGVKFVEIGGETSHADRTVAVDSFQEDPSVKVFIGSSAASVGITLTAASDVFMLEGFWTPAVVDQAIDRCHRISQKSQVTAWYLVSPECAIDSHMFSTVARKRMLSGMALGDDTVVLVADKASGRGRAGYVAALAKMVDKGIEVDIEDLSDSNSVDE